MDLPLRPPPLKRLHREHWVAIDCAVTALLALGYAVLFKTLANLHAIPQWAGAALAAMLVLPAAVRRLWPRAVLAIVAVAGAAAIALSSSPAPAIAVAFVMYLIPLRFPRRQALRLLAAALLVTVAGLTAFAFVPHGRYGPGGLAGAASLLLEDGVLIAAAWMIGYTAKQQRAYSAGLHEQARQRASDQVDQVRRASSAERLRIARELHDVVAHSMSLIAVQAGVANYVVGTHPQEAVRALESIEQTSRGALAELRALLEVLRAEPDAMGPDATEPDATELSETGPPRRDTRLIPLPGLANLDSLAARTADAGVRVDLEVCGERQPLSPGLDLAAYRVIQEAITNVIKHAATDSCQVTVAYQADVLAVEISDSGAGRAGDGSRAPAGHGIAGMRERVGMYGGTFLAAPLPGGGFRVAAQFPLAGTAA
ncbi:MAG TPA: sensor histidine kinase [Streptosporangiaceae bacterium]